MKAMEWLAAQADNGFIPAAYPGPPEEVAGDAGELFLDPGYRTFLGLRNGLYAFARALHIFGLDAASPHHDVRERNRAGAWRRAYGPVLEGMGFFAEDVFGHLFGLRNQEVFSVDPETAKLTKVGTGFSGWVEYLVGDLSYATGGGLAKAYADANGPIPFDNRLSPKKPFLLGGEYSLANLRPLPWEKNLEFKSEIYRQTKGLPEGANIEIRSQ